MNVFVTGGSGFVGGHVIERLSRAGHQVFALARSADSAKVVEGYGAKAVRGDLDTVTSKELAGADVVVHAAAYVKSYGPRSAFVAGNVDGTRRMLEAAKAAGVKRFVHISTEAALFDGGDLLEIDETAPIPARHKYLYSETKADAEKLVLWANTAAFTTLALRPRLVWGPRDGAVLPEVLEAVKKGAFAWIDHGGQRTSTTWVGNLAAAVELSLTKGQGGQAYFIADEGTQSMREFLTALASTQKVTLPSRSIPGAMARPIASIVEKTWSVFAPKRKPPMVGFSVAMLSRSVTVKTDKARRDLGYSPEVSVEQGLASMKAT